MDRHELAPRYAHTFGLEPSQGLRDRDDARRPRRECALHESERAGTKRIVVVLRRHEPACAERAVEIGVDEVRVHDVRSDSQHGARNSRRQERVDVARGRNALVRDGQVVVERIRCA